MRYRVAAFVVGCVLAMGSVHAAEPLPPADEDRKVALASQLVEYGMDSRDALALVVAARMLRSFSARVLLKNETGRKGKVLDPDALLNRAREFARGKTDLVAVIDGAESEEGDDKVLYFESCQYEWYVSFVGGGWYKWVCYE